MALPPLEAGAVQGTVACPLPAVALTAVGAPGTVAGVTALEAIEARPVPPEVVAATVDVSAVPLRSPVTVSVVAVGLQAVPPWAGVPLAGGGGPGGAAGVAEFEADDAAPVPAALVAATVNV